MLGRRASFDVMSMTQDDTRSMKASAAVAKSYVHSMVSLGLRSLAPSNYPMKNIQRASLSISRHIIG